MIDVDFSKLTKTENASVFLNRWHNQLSYSIVQKFEKWEYLVLTVDPMNNWETINNKNYPKCESDCVNFILKNNKIVYTNLNVIWKFDYSNLSVRLWGIYKITSNWVIFDSHFWWWGLCASSSHYSFTYVNFNSLKSAKKRDKNCKIVRRKGRLYVINKTNPRFKARQG